MSRRACFSAALSTGFCFEEVTLVLAPRPSGSALPGNRCELSQPRTMNARLPREFGPPRADKLKLALSSTARFGGLCSLPAERIETPGLAETSVARTKANKLRRARPRLSRRPFDTEPSDGDAETRRSGAVVLECRLCVSKAFTRRLFCRPLREPPQRAASQFDRYAPLRHTIQPPADRAAAPLSRV